MNGYYVDNITITWNYRTKNPVKEVQGVIVNSDKTEEVFADFVHYYMREFGWIEDYTERLNHENIVLKSPNGRQKMRIEIGQTLVFD